MAKYDALRDWLAAQTLRSEITLSFGDIERLIEGGLPTSAHRHRAWWGNNEASVQATAWMSAGWRVDAVDAAASRVRFHRERPGPTWDVEAADVRQAPAAAVVAGRSTQTIEPPDVLERQMQPQDGQPHAPLESAASTPGLAHRFLAGGWSFVLTIASAGLLAAVPFWHAAARLKRSAVGRLAIVYMVADAVLFLIAAVTPERPAGTTDDDPLS